MRLASTARQRNLTALHRDARWVFFYGPIKLTWLSALLAVIGLSFANADAAKQQTIRKNPPKAKRSPTTPPARKISAVQRAKPLLSGVLPDPIDPFERREHILHRTRQGETLSDLFGSYKLSAAEKQLWIRSLTREIGRRPLPVGKDVHLYFAKPTLIRSGPNVLGQLQSPRI